MHISMVLKTRLDALEITLLYTYTRPRVNGTDTETISCQLATAQYYRGHGVPIWLLDVQKNSVDRHKHVCYCTSMAVDMNGVCNVRATDRLDPNNAALNTAVMEYQ
jgi:hypothetical protein